MACPISFGKIDTKHIIYPIIPIIILIIQNYFVYKTEKLNNIGMHQLVKIIVKSFGKSLAVIPYLLFRKEINHSLKINAFTKENLIYKKEYYKKIIIKNEILKKRKYFIILLNIVMNFGYEILICNFTEIKEEKFFSLWIFDIFYIWGFSYFILEYELYRHQYLSIIIITILGIIINIINGLNTNFHTNNFIITLWADILFSLNIVISKYLMENLLFTEYEICFYEGFFSLIISIICLAIFTNIEINSGIIIYKEKKYIDNFYHYYDSINTEEIVVLILALIAQLIVYLFGLITIKFYTVFHIFILLIFIEGDFYRYPLKDSKLYVNIILFLFLLIMILVFSENIELNCFGLQKYTKKNIIRRASTDYLNDNDDLNDNINDSSNDNVNEKANNENIIEIERFRFDFSDYIIV